MVRKDQLIVTSAQRLLNGYRNWSVMRPHFSPSSVTRVRLDDDVAHAVRAVLGVVIYYPGG